jgi:glycosyltransferase involved in cell wall biosynthesis
VTRILYLPLATDNTNRYSENMMEVLAEFGTVSGFTVGRGVKGALRGRMQRSDVIFLNWLENEIVSKGGALSVPGFAKCMMKLALSRVFARKLVYVRHNRYPHRTRAQHRASVAKAADFLEARCDASVVHSMTATAGSRLYVPHPLYKVNARPEAPHEGERYFVCFGRILRYKNLEALIRCFPADRRLLIVGACDDPAYLDELDALASPNIAIRGGYIDEEEAQRLVSGSEGVIICHAENDVIVSGTFFYAMSLGVRVYALRTEFTAWAQRELGGELVQAHDSVESLARSLPATPRTRPADGVDPRVQRLFGTQAVRQAVSEVMRKIGLR